MTSHQIFKFPIFAGLIIFLAISNVMQKAIVHQDIIQSVGKVFKVARRFLTEVVEIIIKIQHCILWLKTYGERLQKKKAEN